MQKDTATRRQVFTEYLRRLDSSDEPPATEHVAELLGALREALRDELRKRGLWDAPPSYLGVYGLRSWHEADWRTPLLAGGCSMEWDLVIECFKYIFLDRYRYLARQLETRPDIEGLVYRNIRNFLHDTQKKHDPLGFRVFVMVRSAVLLAVEEGDLYVLQGDPRIRNHTVLGCVEERRPQAARSGLLGKITRSWNDVLLPDLITAHGRHHEEVVAMLRSLLSRLPAQGVEIFRCGELIDSFKNDIRSRWAKLFEAAGGSTVEEGDERALQIVRGIGPDTRFEQRETFFKLVDCVTRALARLEETPAVRRHLSRLWSFLTLYAADPEEPWASLGQTSPSQQASGPEAEAHRLPSRRELSRQLGIPRNRMPRLYSLLGEVAATCRERLSATPSTLSASGGKAPRENPMNDREKILQSLRQGTAEARRRAAELVRSAGSPVAPGDLFLLPRTAELGVEWAFIARDPHHPRRFLAIPADPNPLAGSSDVAVSREAPGGPLTLRCAFGTWLDENELDRPLRTGVLEPQIIEQAQHEWQRLREPAPAGSQRAQEVDADPEYGFWVEDVLEPARAAVREAMERRGELSSGVVPAFPSLRRWSSVSRVWGIAASVLLLVTLGLSGGLIRMDQDRRRLEQAYDELARERKQAEEQRPSVGVLVNPAVVTLPGWGALRAEAQTLTVSPETPLVVLLWSVDEPELEHRLEITQHPGGEEIWSGGVSSDASGELSVALPASRLPAGDYRLRLSTAGEGRAELVGEYRLSIEME